MTKAMKLHVTFDSYYGGHTDEYVLLPLDINGVFFEKLDEGEYDQVVHLGEIAGKHSECYGDLEVSFVDLDELSIKEVTDLISGSDIGEFESYLEGAEEDFQYEDEDKHDEEKIMNVLKSYGVDTEKRIWGYTSEIYTKFIEQLEEKYVQSFKSIVVLKSDYATAIETLERLGVETFE